MNSGTLIKKLHLSPDDFTAVRNAVRDAEENTSGEIAAAIIGESTDYSFYELFASVIFGAAVFALLLPFYDEITALFSSFMWVAPPWFTAAFYGMAGFAGIGLFFLFANIPVIDRLVIPKKSRSRAVYTRALRYFVESGVYATKERTGILIFISCMEREVIILADKGISSKIDQSVWNTLSGAIAAGVKSGNTAGALIETIEACGKTFKENFPADTTNENELPDGLVVLESGV